MAGAYTLKTLPYMSMKSRHAPAGVDLTGQAQEAVSCGARHQPQGPAPRQSYPDL